MNPGNLTISAIFIFTLVIMNLLTPILAVGQISQVTGSPQSATTTGTTLTITKPSGLAVGDVMIANIIQSDASNNEGGDLSNATATNWTIIDGREIGYVDGGFFADDEWWGTVLYKIAVASDVAATSFSFTLDNDANGDGSAGAILAFRQVDAVSGFNASGTANSGPFDIDPGTINVSGSVTTVTALTTTTSTANAAVIMFGLLGNDRSFNNTDWELATGPLSMTELYDVPNNTTLDNGIGAAWVIKTTTGSTGAGTAVLSSDARNGGLLVVLRPFAIKTSYASGFPACAGANRSAHFTYSPPSGFPAGTTTFTAQLSDASGSFASPVIIGTVASDASGSQDISADIPDGTAAGTGYRIRVISNTPAITGSANGTDLTIWRSPEISVQPGNQTVCGGSNTATFTVTASGENLGYIWQRSSGSVVWRTISNPTDFEYGCTYSDYTTASLTISNAPVEMNAVHFRCKVHGNCNPEVITDENATLFVNVPPTTADAGPDQTDASTCGLTQVTMAANTAVSGTGTWSIISGTGGFFNNTSSPVSTFSGTAGNTYQLRWTITAPACSPSADDVFVTFNTNPVANFTVTGNPADVGGSINYTSTSTGIPAPTYAWTFNNGIPATSVSSSQSVTYYSPGGYDVILEATNVCGSNSKTKPITVNAGNCNVNLWTESFTYANGTVAGTGNPTTITSWTSANPGVGTFQVNGNRLRATGTNNLGTPGTWETSISNLIDITNKSNVNISIQLYNSGNLDATSPGLWDAADNLRIEYSLNGGAYQTFNTNGYLQGNFTNGIFAQQAIPNGNSAIRLRAKALCWALAGGEYYEIDNVVITYDLQLSVDDPADQVVNIGDATAAVTFNGNATTYFWSNNNSSIGLAATGTGTIGSFTAQNPGPGELTATITVTPVTGTCTGTSQSFAITVNSPCPSPFPAATPSETSRYMCSGTPVTVKVDVTEPNLHQYRVTSIDNPGGVTGVTPAPYNRPDGQIIETGTLENTLASVQQVVYTILPYSDGPNGIDENGGGDDCTGTTFTVTLYVYPRPNCSINTFTDPGCFAGTNGTVTIEAGGGNPPYSYSVDNGAYWIASGSNPYQYGGLLANVPYMIKVKDNNGCESK